MNALYEMLVRVAKCDGAETCFEEEEPTTTTTTTTLTPSTSTSNGGRCQNNEVTFHPFPGLCEYYIMCACGTEVLLQCAPGLYFDQSLNNCNFQQLVDCTPSESLKSAASFLTHKYKRL